MNFLEQLTYNLGPGEDYENAQEFAFSELAVRIIAFYLPQFHPIPENDKWWGKGFTEWTNVTSALPRFSGHYQPHLPGELGFYDLRLPDALRAQAKLARQFGIYGFCFHYYWFGGRKLLETPLKNLLSNSDIDIPFCINWANESWSRRWDGSESDILMEQRHSEDDDFAFANALEPIVRDPRYIRIGDRPLIMVYRPRIMPDAAATVRRWREQFKLLRLPDPYIVMAQAFYEEDPRPFGMDAAAGFPPHRWWHLAAADKGAIQLFTNGYRGRRLSYDELAQSAAEFDPTEYTQFPGVCPSWDNEARKPNRGISFVGATPRRYGAWLDNACRKALRRQHPDERLVFVNAWNEWAEGTHLEPDRHLGYAYLNETARVLSNLTSAGSKVESAHSVRQSNSHSAIKQLIRKVAKRVAMVLEWFAMILRSM
jgi:lipopolysaccharide biosynthesis protein